MGKLKEIVGNIATSLYNSVYKLPPSVRLLIRDVLEGAAAAVVGLQVVMPTSADDAKRVAVTVFVAVSAAVVAIVRRWIWNQIINKLGDGEG